MLFRPSLLSQNEPKYLERKKSFQKQAALSLEYKCCFFALLFCFSILLEGLLQDTKRRFGDKAVGWVGQPRISFRLQPQSKNYCPCFKSLQQQKHSPKSNIKGHLSSLPNLPSAWGHTESEGLRRLQKIWT